jgi:hypothetical protein
MIIIFNTLMRNWLLSLIFSPSGRDKREGAGRENPFSRPVKVNPMAWQDL